MSFSDTENVLETAVSTNLNKLVEEFKQQAADNDGNITINKATFDTAGLNVTDQLNDLINVGFTVSNGQVLIDVSDTSIPAPDKNSLVITGAKMGEEVLGVAAENTAVTLSVTADENNNAQFTILIDLPESWKFSTSWSTMTGGVFKYLPYTNSSFVFSTQEEKSFSWNKKDVSLAQGQNFACFIGLTGWLSAVTEFLVSWNGSTQIALAGGITPIADGSEAVYPQMNLFASLKDAELISLGFLSVSNPGVGLKVDAYEKGKAQIPAFYFHMALSAGDDIELDFNTYIQPPTNDSEKDKKPTTFTVVGTNPTDKALTPYNVFGLMDGQNWFSNIPSVLQQFLSKIAFKGFNAVITFEDSKPVFKSLSSEVASTSPWELFSGFTIDSFNVNWLLEEKKEEKKPTTTKNTAVAKPTTSYQNNITFTAKASFFPTVFKGGFDVEIAPDMTISSSFKGSVSLGDLVEAVTDGVIVFPTDLVSLELTSFGMNMNVNQKSYAFYASGDVSFKFITNVSLTGATAKFSSTVPATDKSKKPTPIYKASVVGQFTIGLISLQTSVDYSSAADGGWVLSANLPTGQTLNMGEVVDQLFQEVGFSLPEQILPTGLEITQFSLSADIPNDIKSSQKEYKVKGGFTWDITIPVVNEKLTFEASLALSMTESYNSTGKIDKTVYKGVAAGSVLFESFGTEVDLSYTFEPNNQSITFTWEGFSATYNMKDGEDTIVFSIENWSVGSLITALMKTIGLPYFELPAPWNILNKISLDGFEVIYNLSNKNITVSYTLPQSIDLGIIRIDGLSFTKTSGKKGKVELSLKGSSIVPSINESNLFNPDQGQDIQQMPDVPGEGNEYLDIRLLAMGQHVALTDVASYNSIQEVTTAMENAFKEPEEDKLPVGPNSGNPLLKFDENSNWLIASDLGILKVGKDYTVELQAVFNDPNLYGLRVAMAGAKAKVFAGLDFEIMYKKISDSVGVYQMELTLPDAIRYLQFGAVNVTLPSVGLAIYTNGDFMVDIGFPYKMDFSRSFTVQAIVPPGIPAMGSGGFYFGKLSSTTTKKVPQTSYGNFNPVIVFGIGMQVGIGYSIHYGVLSGGFSITIFGILEGVIATYHPFAGALQENNSTEVETSYYYWVQGTLGMIGKLYGSLNFGIISASVNLTVKVYAQATLEAYNKMPLAIEASVSVKVTAKLNLGLFSIKIHFSFDAKIRTDLTIGTDNTQNAPWNKNLAATTVAAKSLVAFPAIQARRVTPMHYMSTLQLAEAEKTPLDIYFIPYLTVAGSSTELKDQAAQFVSMLWIDAPVAQGNQTTTDDPSTFEVLSKNFFQWLITNYVHHDQVEVSKDELADEGITNLDLDQLMSFLSSESNPIPIPTASIIQFLSTTFSSINIKAEPGETLSKNESATVFPMFYDLELKVPKGGQDGKGVDINFAEYNQASEQYLSDIKKMFAQLAVQVNQENNPNQAAYKAVDETTYSLATFVFEDYFVMLGKQLIGYAQDALKAFTYPLTATSSLTSVANWANGIESEGTAQNQVNIPEMAKANQNAALTTGKNVQISGVLHTIESGDVLASVAFAYAIPVSILIDQNQSVPGVVAPQKITIGDKDYAVTSTDTLTTIAQGLDMTLAELSANSTFVNSVQLEPTASLIIAATYYITQNGDTPESFIQANGGAFSLTQENFLCQNQLISGLFISSQEISLSGEESYTTVPGDTIVSIASKTNQSVEDLVSGDALQALNIQPLKQLLIPPFAYETVAEDTLGKIAQAYNTTASILGQNYANQQEENLFASDSNQTLVVPNLVVLDIQSVLQYIEQQNLYSELSGIVSRYQLHGMRIPTDKQKLANLPDYTAYDGPTAAIYAQTGQEFALPSTVETGFEIQLIATDLSWLTLGTGDTTTSSSTTQTLTLSLTKEDVDQVTNVTSTVEKDGVQPPVISLNGIEPFTVLPVQYTFQTVTQWISSGKVTLPSPAAASASDLLIWNFPSGLLEQVAQTKTQGTAFDIQVGSQNVETGKMEYNTAKPYAWATVLEIDIKKQVASLDELGGSAGYTYELLGANEGGTQLLERLLRVLPKGDAGQAESLCYDIQWLYEGTNGMMSVGDEMTSYVVQSNLSTETNPAPAARSFMAKTAATSTKFGHLQKGNVYDFMKLLWEGSITRSGGYYLLYNETEGNQGFPDSLFDSSGNATISLYIAYQDAKNVLATYMNTAITGSKIDLGSSVVFAEASLRNLTHTVEDGESLSKVVSQYNVDLHHLVHANKGRLLAADKTLQIDKLHHVVGLSSAGSANTLQAIASHYDVSHSELADHNPQLKQVNELAHGALVKLPKVVYKTKQGDSLESVAAHHQLELTSLAHHVKEASLFDDETTLDIPDQVTYKSANVPQGTAGFVLDRTITDDDDETTQTYLSNLYNLLGYKLIANEYFDASSIGLPTGPATVESDQGGTTTDIWEYKQVVPVAPYAVENTNMNYPAGYPDEAGNPYRGIGNMVQVNFDWVDFYGNNTITPFSDPSLDPSYPANNLKVQVGYMDELKGIGQWPSTFVTYGFKKDGDSPELTLNFSFDVSRYQGPAESGMDYTQNAKHDLSIYTLIYYQLNQIIPPSAGNAKNTVDFTLDISLVDGGSITLSLDQVNEFVKSIYTYLTDIASGQQATAPANVVISETLDVNSLNTESIFELAVSLTLTRDLDYVNDYFKDSPSVVTATTAIQPNTAENTGENVKGGTQNHTLTAFALNFEQIFLQEGEYSLKLTTGIDESLAGSSKNQTLFVVRMGYKSGNGIYWSVKPAGTFELTTTSITELNNNGVSTSVTDKLTSMLNQVYTNIESFETDLNTALGKDAKQYGLQVLQVASQNGYFYAPQPISTSLESKNRVQVPIYKTGSGITGDTTLNYSGIDMDIWGKQCLEAIDLFLSSEYAVPAYTVDNKALDAIIESKNSLAETISSQVVPILAAPIASAEGLAGAQEKMKQQLLMKLGNAYSITAIVQLEAEAESGMQNPNNGILAPRLYGTPTVNSDEAEEDSKLYSISNAKVQLNYEGASTQQGDLSFVFSTKDVKENNGLSNISLDMDYQVTHLEFNIQDVPDIEGYQSSQWLSFLVPVNLSDQLAASSTSVLEQQLGVLDIPVVLRNYPSPPVLSKQLANQPSETGETSIEDRIEVASEWNFDYTYTQDQVGQDEIYSQVLFNQNKTNQDINGYAVSGQNLFTSMAQLLAILPQLQDDFNKYLTKITPDSDSTGKNWKNAAEAISTFSKLVNNLTKSWKAQPGLFKTMATEEDITTQYDFKISQAPAKVDDVTSNLLVTVVVPEELSTLDKKLFEQGETYPEAPIPHVPIPQIEGYLTEKTAVANQYQFKNANGDYLTFEEGMAISQRMIEFSGLNVMQFQNTWAGIGIIRNENLVPYNPTNLDFIYHTPIIRFSNMLVPLLQNVSKLDISELLAPSKNSVPDYLSAFFKEFFHLEVFKQQQIQVECAWNYALPLPSTGEGLLPDIQIPVLMFAPFEFEIPADYTTTHATAFVNKINKAMETWYKDKKPVTNQAYFSFNLSVFASSSETQLPIIKLTNIVLPFDRIDSSIWE